MCVRNSCETFWEAKCRILEQKDDCGADEIAVLSCQLSFYFLATENRDRNAAAPGPD